MKYVVNLAVRVAFSFDNRNPFKKSPFYLLGYSCQKAEM